MSEVADALATLSRMMGRLSDLAAFRQASLGLTEWLFLRQLAGADAERRGYVYYSEVPPMAAVDLERKKITVALGVEVALEGII